MTARALVAVTSCERNAMVVVLLGSGTLRFRKDFVGAALEVGPFEWLRPTHC